MNSARANPSVHTRLTTSATFKGFVFYICKIASSLNLPEDTWKKRGLRGRHLHLSWVQIPASVKGWRRRRFQSQELWSKEERLRLLRRRLKKHALKVNKGVTLIARKLLSWSEHRRSRSPLLRTFSIGYSFSLLFQLRTLGISQRVGSCECFCWFHYLRDFESKNWPKEFEVPHYLVLE
jgi:hypothetical protein